MHKKRDRRILSLPHYYAAISVLVDLQRHALLPAQGAKLQTSH
jgi:hypothetical protein